MTIKQLLLPFTFLLTITTVTDTTAQKVLGEVAGVRVTATDVISREPKETVFNISDLTLESFKVYIKSESDSKVETYDGNMKLVSSESVELGTSKSEDRKDADYYRFVTVNGKKYVLSIYVEKGENIFTVVAVGNDGMNESEPTEFLRLPKENAFRDFKYQRPDILKSDNGSYVLLAMKLPEPDKSDPPVFTYQYVMFGPEMKVLWSKEMKYNHSEGIQRVENEFPLNDGSVVSLTRVDKGRGFEAEKRFEQRLYHINADNVDKAGFSAIGKVLLKHTELKTGGISATLTYGLRSYEGLLLVDWSFDGDPIVKKVPYGIDHLTKKATEKQVKKYTKANEKGKPLTIEKFEVEGVKKMADGTRIVHGQERWFNEDFITGPIRLFGLNKSNEMVWSQVIPVKQTRSGTNEGLGYLFKVVGDMAYVIFNDNYRNLSWDESSSDPSTYSGPDNPVVLVSFDINDPDGTYSRKQLWESKDVGGMFSLSKYYHAGDNDFGVAYIQGRHLKECLVKIEFGAK
jgi:hypothetical protein